MINRAAFEPVTSNDQFAAALFVPGAELEVLEWLPFSFFKNWRRPVDFPA